MRLHRLTLKNYRGIDHRAVEFPDHGVVVICGANEIGKSSMIEALDLLLGSKDRSTKKNVKAIKPTHADVGAEVTAEISTGPYRFVYHKRFHKCPETQLTVIQPRREQLSGDEAHERVCGILDETLDTALWQAQQVLQAEATEAVTLSGCDALSRALDIAAGNIATPSGTESLLIERIDAEYARYFTKTGRPTEEWAAARDVLAAAEAEVTRCAALVAEVDERVRRHDELTGQLAALSAQQGGVDARYAAAQEAAAKVTELTEALREARLVAAAADATRTASDAAHTERLRLCADVATRTAAVSALDADVQRAAEAEASARTAAEAADAAAEKATQGLLIAEQAVQTARGVVDRLTRRDEADRLAARLAKIDATGRDHDRVCDALAAVTITEAMLRRIEDAAAATDQAEAALAAISTTVEFTAIADIELLLSGQRVALPAGRSWSTTATATTRVDVPGVLTVQVSPGDTRDAHAKHAAAQQELAAALAAAQVSDPEAARHADRQRRELQARRDQLAATMEALRADDPIDELQARLDHLRADQPDPAPDTVGDVETARAELTAAEAQCAAAAEARDLRRRTAAEAADRLTEQSTRATVLRGQADTQHAELAAAVDRLARERAQTGDDALADAVAADQRAAEAATARVQELSRQRAATAPDAVSAELADATAGAQALRTQCDQITAALRDLRVELSVFGTEGRQSRLDAAQAEREHAATQHARIGRRARAVDLLRSVMLRHRDDSRLRYVQPFRAEIERLGRPVFGDSFEVEVDTDLCIRARTLDGRTVPYESLSGGAKEQLGILARLAGAALVAEEDSVPVLMDDALGFTDPDRLASMGAVFDSVGAHGQVIVLTCTPDRYRSVEGAHHIDLERAISSS